MDSTKTRPKNRGKSCLFRCFKLDNIVVDDTFETTSSPRAKTADPLLTYVTVAEKEGIVLPTILSTALTAAKGGGDQGSGCHLRKKGSNSSLRHALMAALNETSLGKMIVKRRKKTKDSLFRSSISNIERGGDKISNQERRIALQTYSSTSSSCSSAFTPSSLSSTTSSSSSSGTQALGSSSEQYCALRSLPVNGNGVTKPKQEVGDNRKGCYGSNNMTVCLLLTSLLVLILYGKFCAILCTSIGFFVVFPRWKRPCNEGSLETDFDSVQYKKKIIMEGMLERRSRITIAARRKQLLCQIHM